MNYINQYKLIRAIQISGNGLLDRKALLSIVDRNQIFDKLQKTNHESINAGKFLITEEPIEEENWSKMPQADKRKIWRLNEKIKRSQSIKDVIKDLESYIKKYPGVPTIYNYLGIAYEKANQEKEYREILLETIAKFPDYIFGKISLAEYYLSLRKEYKKIPGLLNNKFEITQHFPVGTDCFHISVIRGFYYITGRYFARAGNIEMAYKSYFLLSDLDMNHMTTEILGQEIIGSEISSLKRKIRMKRSRRL